MAEENVLPIPNLALPQECFVLQQSSLAHLHVAAREALLGGIKADQMAPYYRLVVAANVLPLDQALLDKLEKENAAELERLDQLLKEAEETIAAVGRELVIGSILLRPPRSKGRSAGRR